MLFVCLYFEKTLWPARGLCECDPCSCSCGGLAGESSQFPCLQKALLLWTKHGTPRLHIIRMRSRETCCLCINGRRRKVLSVKMLKCEARGKRAMKRLASRLQPGLLASGAGWSFLPEQRSCDSLTRFPQILAVGLSSWPALGMHISPVPSECCQAGVTCSVNCEMLIQAG